MRDLTRLVKAKPVQAILIMVIISQTVLILGGSVVLRDIREDIREERRLAQELREEASAASAARLQTAMVCLLAQQHDHRLNTQQAMEHLISLHGLEPPPPHAPPPLPDLPSGVEGCAPFANDGG